MDLGNEAVTQCGDERVAEAPACSCALHEPLYDSDQVSPAGVVGEYVRFSSFSEAWLAHARDFGPHAVRRFNLGSGSLVLGLAGAGVSPGQVWFSHQAALALAAQGKAADLIIAHNLLAQVPDADDAVAGFASILKPEGILTLEFPHVLRLIERDPLAYSLHAVQSLLARHGLRVFDVDELAAQGGSLRLFCCHDGSAWREQKAVARLRDAEMEAGLCALTAYRGLEAAHAPEPVSVG